VSFNQVIGATTPFFTAIFAFLITCKKESAEVYCAPLPVVLGTVFWPVIVSLCFIISFAHKTKSFIYSSTIYQVKFYRILKQNGWMQVHEPAIYIYVALFLCYVIYTLIEYLETGLSIRAWSTSKLDCQSVHGGITEGWQE